MLSCLSDVVGGWRGLVATQLLGDLPFAGQLAPGLQAAAEPPRLFGGRAEQSLGFYALRIGVVIQRVSARWREMARIAFASLTASNPRGVADPVTCFAATVTGAGRFLQPGNLPEDRVRPEYRAFPLSCR